MHQILTKRVEIPWLNRIKVSRRALVLWLIFLVLSLWTWRSSHLINMGLYPDYDEHFSKQMAFQVRIILLVAWFLWILSVLTKNKFIRHCFVFGVCLAFFWDGIRLCFMWEIIAILNQ